MNDATLFKLARHAVKTRRVDLRLEIEYRTVPTPFVTIVVARYWRERSAVRLRTLRVPRRRVARARNRHLVPQLASPNSAYVLSQSAVE